MPEILPWNDFYWTAFTELTTERQIGMAAGPIPRSAIMRYAAEHSLAGDAAEHLAAIMRLVDTEYLALINPSGKDDSTDHKGTSAEISDVAGTRAVLNRLAARAAAVKGKKSKPNGNA